MRRWTTGRGTSILWTSLCTAGVAAASLVGCRGGFDVPGGLNPVDVGATMDAGALGDGGSADGAGPADGTGADATPDEWVRPLTCGNGLVETGEQCDDTEPGAEDRPDDGCFECHLEPGWTCSGAPSLCDTRCGDGVRVKGPDPDSPIEACDDGNTLAGDGCSPACEEEPGWGCDGSPSTCEETCGDGLVVGSEDCDPGDGVEMQGCTACHATEGWSCNAEGTSCAPDCGDGLTVADEACDDGNPDEGDGCTPGCTVEDGWTCDNTVVPSLCTPPCGDGIRQPGEECDAGDLDLNDPAETGCTSDCVAAPGWICDGPDEQPCYTECGDGIRAGNEACDVGDQSFPAPYDQACVGCQVGDGWKCDPDTQPSECTPVCGDGTVVAPVEGCDDKNTESGDGCDKDCQPEPGWFCPPAGGSCETVCGDAQWAVAAEAGKGEGCDDGNEAKGDGCDSGCKVEKGWSCAGAPGDASVCGTVCGDGIVVAPYESCDTGEKGTDDGCSDACQVEDGWTCSGEPSECVKLCDDADGDGYGLGQACLGPDCDDGRADVYPGAYELCDNVDNDCDDATDEEVTRPCSSETPAFAHAGVGLCKAGVQLCEGGVWQPSCVGEVLPVAEACGDQQDNDCDGTTDEGCGCLYLNKGEGVCLLGVPDPSDLAQCLPPPQYEPNESSCDGLDNDCDGTIDEGCGCFYLNKDKGVCLLGVPDPSDLAQCLPPPQYEPNESSCDGLDNDCDGSVDEGCPCDYLGSNMGVCAQGFLDKSGACTKPSAYEGTEQLCDGLDNDCDGVADVGCPCEYQGKAQGVCANALVGPEGLCGQPEHFEANEASCDNLDNDCDGLVDEGTDQPCYEGPNGTVGPGRPCHGGVRACVNGSLGACTGQVLPATEVCGNGIDDDCDGTVDNDGPGIVVCDGPGTSIDCKSVVPQCNGDGGQWGCAVTNPQAENCGTLGRGNGVDDDCDGLTDEGCNACALVVPEGYLMGISGITVFHSIQEAINAVAQSPTIYGHRVCVAVGGACASSQTAQTATYVETLQMRNGVDVQGGYEATYGVTGVELTLAPSHCVTEVKATEPQGHTFDQTITEPTTLSGFTLYASNTAIDVIGGPSGDGGAGGAPSGGTPGGVTPESMTAVVTIAGAHGAKLVGNRIYGGKAGDASYGVVIQSLDPASPAQAELVGNTIEGGNASVLSVGVLVSGAQATIRACQPNTTDAAGRCPDGWADKIHISAEGNDTDQAYGVWLDGASDTLVDQAAIYANATKEAAAVGVVGNAAGVRVTRSALDAFGGSVRNAGLLVQSCAGASPWIADNFWIAGSGASGQPATYGVLVQGDCAPLIEANLNIIGCSEGTCGEAYGILCEAEPDGATGACDVVDNASIVGSTSYQLPERAVGIGCRGGACRRIAHNANILGADVALEAVGVELVGQLPQAFIDSNWSVGGCGSTLSAGLVAEDAAARVQNTVFEGRSCSGDIDASNTQSYGALVNTSASGNELDLHSNLLTPGWLWGSSCYAVALALGVSDGAPNPMGPTGAFRNNIIEKAGCDTGLAVPLATFSNALPPRILKNNDLVTDSGYVYWGATTGGSQTLSWLNALAPSPWFDANISAPPGYSSDWPHLDGPGSPCVDAGTPELAPRWDMDGDPRPADDADPPDIGPDEYGPGYGVQPVGG